MATYSRTERLAAIQKAGFADPLTALAVSLAEFGESRDINAQSQSDSLYANGNREQSFGPWQIHLPAHPDVTQSCAMDLTCSTAKAAEISKGGTDFGAWSAFTNGSYARFFDEIKGMLPATSTDPSPSTADPGQTPFPIPAGGCPKGWHQGNMGGAGFCVPDGLQFGGGDPGTNIKNAIPPINIAVPGFEGVGQFFQNLGTAFRPTNMWRAGFLIVGAVLIFAGARLYLAPDRSEVGREVVA